MAVYEQEAGEAMSLDFDLVAVFDAGHADGPVRRSIVDYNITHNVSRMWRRAGCYEALYESSGKLAKDIVPALEEAVRRMRAEPDEYTRLNSPNGWGTYAHALPWLERVLADCKAYPLAVIEADR